MKSTIIALVAGAVLGGSFVVGSFRSVAPAQGAQVVAPVSTAAREWPLTDTERLAANGIETEFARFGIVPVDAAGHLDVAGFGDIAAITSDQNAKRKIANLIFAAQRIASSREVLVHEAEKRCGVAVVQSETKWLERR